MSLSSFLQTDKWFQVLLYNSHNLISFVCTQFVLFDPQTGSYQMLPLQVRVDLGAMVMNGYSTFPKSPWLEFHYQIVLCHISDIRRGSFTPLQICLLCMLQPQPNGLLISSCLFKMLPINYLFTNHIYLIYTYIYEQDLALNNLQRLKCHKRQTTIHKSKMHQFYLA